MNSSEIRTFPSMDLGRRVSTAVAVAVMMVFGFSSPSAAQQQIVSTPGQVIDGVGINPQLGQRIPLDLEFVNGENQTVRLRDLLNDKPVLLHLVYYECPMLCKLSSDGLLKSLETLTLKAGDDFSIVTVSFDPREGPVLSRRAEDMASARLGEDRVKGAWHFLTGSQEAIDQLCESVGFHYRYDEKTGQYAHASGVFALTPDGTISRFLTGIEYGPMELRLSLVEASDGKIGTAGDQVMLLCYMYDPTKGKYGLAIMTAIRAGGFLTVAAMATSIGVMMKRDRQRRASAGSDIEGEWESGEPV